LRSTDLFSETLLETGDVAEETFVLGAEVDEICAFGEFEGLLEGGKVDLSDQGE
jgi:hypothetical protein